MSVRSEKLEEERSTVGRLQQELEGQKQTAGHERLVNVEKVEALQNSIQGLAREKTLLGNRIYFETYLSVLMYKMYAACV